MNIYLFHGSDNYSSTQKLRFWQQEFAKKYSEDSVEVIYDKELKPAEFTTNIEAIPLFSEKRLMIIKNFLSLGNTDDQKKVAEYLDRASDDCVIVFHESGAADKRLTLYKKIKKIGKVEEFNQMEPSEIARWIAKSKDLKISFANANYLSQHCGSDLWNIANELEKLKTYAGDREITREMIDEVSTTSLSSSIFKLTDSIAQKNSKDSLKTFRILAESGEDLMRSFYMIARHFRIMIQVKEMVEKGENQHSMAKKINQHPFVVQKTSQQSRNFTQQSLMRIHGKLLDLDRKFKTGLIRSYATDNRELELAIEKFIIECCQSSQN